jgi:hypothetical protein
MSWDEHKHPREHGKFASLGAAKDAVKVTSVRRGRDPVTEARPAKPGRGKAAGDLERGHLVTHQGDNHEVVATTPQPGGNTRVHTLNKSTGKPDQFTVPSRTELPVVGTRQGSPAAGTGEHRKVGPPAAGPKDASHAELMAAQQAGKKVQMHVHDPEKGWTRHNEPTSADTAMQSAQNAMAHRKTVRLEVVDDPAAGKGGEVGAGSRVQHPEHGPGTVRKLQTRAGGDTPNGYAAVQYDRDGATRSAKLSELKPTSRDKGERVVSRDGRNQPVRNSATMRDPQDVGSPRARPGEKSAAEAAAGLDHSGRTDAVLLKMRQRLNVGSAVPPQNQALAKSLDAEIHRRGLSVPAGRDPSERVISRDGPGQAVRDTTKAAPGPYKDPDLPRLQLKDAKPGMQVVHRKGDGTIESVGPTGLVRVKIHSGAFKGSNAVEYHTLFVKPKDEQPVDMTPDTRIGASRMNAAAAGKADAKFGNTPRLTKSTVDTGMQVEHVQHGTGTVVDVAQRHMGRAKVRFADGSTKGVVLDDLIKHRKK